jgi:hypothetical protein
MKTFKHIVLGLLIAIFSNVSIAVAQENNTKKEITIDKNTTKQALLKMVENLKEEGIDMTIQDVKYNSKERIVNIKGDINFNDGNTADFEAIKLKKIVIVRDYRPDAEKALYILFNPK